MVVEVVIAFVPTPKVSLSAWSARHFKKGGFSNATDTAYEMVWAVDCDKEASDNNTQVLPSPL